MTVFPDSDYGKFAKTHFKVIERFGLVTLIECKLETGRTHQIRVHMKHIGHPLFNDLEYGGNKILRGTVSVPYRKFVENCFSLLFGQALHAKSLGLIQPQTQQKLFFESELPISFSNLILEWRKYCVD
jgi:23S rRNA pseudouridine1911/1915/1917 synthase